VADMGGAPYGGDSLAGQTGGEGLAKGLISYCRNTVPYLFHVRNMFFSCDLI
jgi:hypothetical protein